MEETQIQSQKQFMTEGFEAAAAILGKKRLANTNLTEEELEGRRQIQEGIKTKGWHISTTDKSKKIVLDLAKNYVDALTKHTVKDTQVSIEDIRSLEPMLYDQTAALVRIFALGNDSLGEKDRIVQALKPVICGVYPMSGEAKDHNAL